MSLTRKLIANNVFTKRRCILCGYWFEVKDVIWELKGTDSVFTPAICYECGLADKTALHQHLNEYITDLQTEIEQTASLHDAIESMNTDGSLLEKIEIVRGQLQDTQEETADGGVPFANREVPF